VVNVYTTNPPEKDSQGIENSKSESVDSEILLSKKTGVDARQAAESWVF